MNRRRVWFAPVAIVAAVAAILLAVAWSLTSAPRAGAAPRVDQLMMAGGIAGTDNDPVAAGERRVSVDVMLYARGDEPLEYHVGDFAMAVPGGSPRRPRRAVLPGRWLPPGAQLSGTLVFDVPVTTTRVRRSYDDHPGTQLVLPGESRAPPASPTSPSRSPSTDNGHTSHQHD